MLVLPSPSPGLASVRREGRRIWRAVQIGKCAKLELIGDMHTDNGEDAGTLIREAFMETMLSTLNKTDARGTAQNEE